MHAGRTDGLTVGLGTKRALRLARAASMYINSFTSTCRICQCGQMTFLAALGDAGEIGGTRGSAVNLRVHGDQRNVW